MRKNYQKSLQAWLLLPIVLVVVLSLLILLAVAPAQIETLHVAFILIVTGLVQLAIGTLMFRRLITSRLYRLDHYLSLVISTETAPEGPLVDTVHDEIGEISNNLSNFIEDLKDVLDEIRRDTGVVRKGSEDLSEQISTAEKAVGGSVDEMEKITMSIGEIANSAIQLSSSAGDIKLTTQRVNDLLLLGTKGAQENQESMVGFTENIEGMVSDLELLQEDSNKIGNVLDVIKSIADQTNLLALNAAIEAARAGEQGRGFAVVADEVRALAHRTQESTVEIQTIVSELQTKTTNAVHSIGKSQQISHQSLQQSRDVASTFAEIGEVFHQLDSLTGDISHNIQFQQSSTETIKDRASEITRLNHDVNESLKITAEKAQEQKNISVAVETILKRVCV